MTNSTLLDQFIKKAVISERRLFDIILLLS